MLTRRSNIKSKRNQILRSLRSIKRLHFFPGKYSTKNKKNKKTELTSMGTAVEAKRERSHTYGVYEVAEL